MNPEVAERLGHVLESITSIQGFVAGLGFEQYAASRIHRRAVEREFEIIGEASSIAWRLDPALDEQIPEIRDIVGLRNRVIHGYQDVDDWILWLAIAEDLPRLREQVLALLGSTPGN